MSFISPTFIAPERLLSDDTDRLVIATLNEALRRHRPTGKIALLAAGGYGRRGLAPFSDLDLLLIHDTKRLEDAFVQSLWYPLWDAGFKVGHAVRTPRETLAMIWEDLDTATALVTARVLAGDKTFGARVIEKVRTKLRRRGGRWISELHARVVERHATAGEVAYLLEPDLKEGLGGLRDIQAIHWANAVGFNIPESDLRTLEECNAMLTRIRFALHRTVAHHRMVEIITRANSFYIQKKPDGVGEPVSPIGDALIAQHKPLVSASGKAGVLNFNFGPQEMSEPSANSMFPDFDPWKLIPARRAPALHWRVVAPERIQSGGGVVVPHDLINRSSQNAFQ